jgi:hypothetical protein
MTILAFLGLFFGIFLIADGAFRKGLLVTILPGLGIAGAAVIRIAEVLDGGNDFLLSWIGL